MKTDLVEEVISGFVDSSKAYAYMFLKVVELVKKIGVVYTQMFHNFMDGVNVPTPFQSKSYKLPVALNCSIQPGNKAVYGIKMIVKDTGSSGNGIKLILTSQVFLLEITWTINGTEWGSYKTHHGRKGMSGDNHGRNNNSNSSAD